MDDPDWPDFVDPCTGVFTYFGDNKNPGSELHKTPRKGNQLLRDCFEGARAGAEARHAIAPFLVFTRGKRGRDVIFRGLAVPGTRGGHDDLVAVWRIKNGERFQNYRAMFTILDVAEVKREWIDSLVAGSPTESFAPLAWRKWSDKAVYEPLIAKQTIHYRTQAEQVPKPGRDQELVRCLYEFFKDHPTDFESCAAELAAMMDPNINIKVITRRSVDGGYDATGDYCIGPLEDRVALSFCLEAKCYAPENGVGVRELARLISRLRHREFGILVTTSFLARQAYDELRHDSHPVVVIAGTDIAAILVAAGYGTRHELLAWLSGSFPKI